MQSEPGFHFALWQQRICIAVTVLLGGAVDSGCGGMTAGSGFEFCRGPLLAF
jgi:hypothetical protein